LPIRLIDVGDPEATDSVIKERVISFVRDKRVTKILSCLSRVQRPKSKFLVNGMKIDK